MKRACLLFALLASGCVRIIIQPLRDAELVARSRMYRATSDLRDLGLAIDSYNAANGSYPSSADWSYPGSPIPLAEANMLALSLTGHLRVLAATDPWGEPYLYWNSGQGYFVLSLGADRKVTDPGYLANLASTLSSSSQPVLATTSHCLEDEIIFAFGRFIKSPGEDARLCSLKARSQNPLP